MSHTHILRLESVLKAFELDAIDAFCAERKGVEHLAELAGFLNERFSLELSLDPDTAPENETKSVQQAPVVFIRYIGDIRRTHGKIIHATRDIETIIEYAGREYLYVTDAGNSRICKYVITQHTE